MPKYDRFFSRLNYFYHLCINDSVFTNTNANDWPNTILPEKTQLRYMPRKHLYNIYYVRVFWGFLEPYTSYVRTCSLHKVRENCHFLNPHPLRNV